MKPVLFSYFRSSCSYRCRIALNFKGIEFEYRPVHLVNNGGEQFYDDFTILNPMAQIPYFIDDKVQVGQSMAIIDYLDQRYNEKPLFPKDLSLRSKVIEICEIINSGIQPLQNLSVLKYLESEFEVSSEQKSDWIKKFMEKGLTSIEKKIRPNSDYCFGEITAADVFLIPQVYNANRFNIDMDKFPKIQRVNSFCTQQEVFQLAHPDKQPDFQA